MSDAQKEYEGTIILGSPRSGTTLLRRLVNAHPALSCPSETNVFSSCARLLKQDAIADGVKVGLLSGLAFAGIPEELALARVRELAFGFHREIAAKAGKKQWVSKTAFDSFYVDEIERLCAGKVRFVCLTRHGVDVVCSLRDLCDKNEVFLPEIHEYIIRHAAPLTAFAELWKDLSLRLRRLLDDHPEDSMSVRYEDLVANPKETMSNLFRFLGEDPEAAELDQALQKRDSVGLGDWKTYQTTAVQRSSVGRGKELSAHTLSHLGVIMNPTLELMGYPKVTVLAERNDAETRRRYEMGLLVQSMKR